MTFTCLDWYSILLLHWFFYFLQQQQLYKEEKLQGSMYIAWPYYFIYSIDYIYTSEDCCFYKAKSILLQCSVFFFSLPLDSSCQSRLFVGEGLVAHGMDFSDATRSGGVKQKSMGGTLHHRAPRALHRPVKICHDLWKVREFRWMDVLDFMTWMMFLWKLTVLLVGIKQDVLKGLWHHFLYLQ